MYSVVNLFEFVIAISHTFFTLFFGLGRMDFGRYRFTGDSFYSNDLYAFNVITKTWSEIRPDTSSERQSIQHHQHQQPQHQNTNANDTTLTRRKFSPCGRRSHSAVVHKNKILIFGGFQENLHKHFNDLYQFDTGKKKDFTVFTRK